MRSVLTALLLASAVNVHYNNRLPSFAYIYTCLDGCECDTVDEIIHCHNSDRTELRLPAEGERLRGFPVIGATFNKINVLPDEDLILSRFPDLKIIDVERNPSFDCSTLKNFKSITILSDCSKTTTEIERIPKLERPTKECGLSCQAETHYNKLHEYAVKLWSYLKKTYNNFDLTDTVNEIGQFMMNIVNQINNAGKDFGRHR